MQGTNFKIFNVISYLLIMSAPFALIAGDGKQHRFITEITSKSVPNVSASAKALPHKLLVGRCEPKNTFLLHAETIVLNNDNNSNVMSTIKTLIDGPVEIKCLTVVDNPQEGKNGGYLFYVNGGPGHNHVTFGIWTSDGFNISVNIFGQELTEKQNEKGRIEN
ncbi:uncharacterized protein LOC108737606 [Agrilus planipennis]|uniref:Uncharacterized protein LOC108737606 n=1 Tax=Agrilus planipennis TaxID=224129 RepID=A0A1W4WQ58_AGRPL|nr:uncharacterized protein LOC108737606 [Agrilus planipennis]